MTGRDSGIALAFDVTAAEIDRSQRPRDVRQYFMILLRHGQSEFNLHYNATGIDPGIPDAPLTELGHRQADAAAKSLAGEDIRRVICSPYTRALQTATPVAERLRLPIEVTSSVRERFGSSCDIGAPRERLARAWPHLDLAALDEIWWPDDDEPHHEVEARAAAFRRELALRTDWEHTLVVCHWGFIFAMTGLSLNNCQWLRWTVLDVMPGEVSIRTPIL